MDLVIELHKVGGSDFKGGKEGERLIPEFDSDGFGKIDQCVFSLKNPEKGACQYFRAFFGKSRLAQVHLMYHSVSLNYTLHPKQGPSRPRVQGHSKPASPFMEALSELTGNRKSALNLQCTARKWPI